MLIILRKKSSGINPFVYEGNKEIHKYMQIKEKYQNGCHLKTMSQNL